MANSAHTQTGVKGEQIATNYLLGLGYEIVDRNYRAGHLEVDIIARRQSTLYFVEVKTRSHDGDDKLSIFSPEAAMTTAKRQRLDRAIERYLADHPHPGETSLELIAINLSPNSHRLRHYRAIQWG